MEKVAAVYIMASKRNGTLYIGVTTDLIKRVWQHKSEAIDGFTKKYGVHRLVIMKFIRTLSRPLRAKKQ